METPGASDEEYFDAFESTAQLKLSLVPLEKSEMTLQDPITPEIESKLLSSYHSPAYDSSPNLYLSDYSTYNSLSNKDPDTSRSHSKKLSIRNTIKKYRKDAFDFADLDEIQEIILDENPFAHFWVTKFSPDGRFLAVTGDIHEVKVFEVSKQRANGPQHLFYDVPYCTMKGHTSSILDLS